MDDDFEHNHFPLTANFIYRIGHIGTRIIKWMAHYDKYNESIEKFDFMASLLSCLDEIF